MSLALFSEGNLARSARDMGIEVHIFPKRYRGDLRPLKQLICFIKAEQIDIVHTHLISGNLYGRLAGKLANVKGIISTQHHSRKDAVGFFPIPFMQDLFFHGDNIMGLLSDRIITPSENLKKLVLKYGINPSRVITIPNAINMDKTGWASRDVLACMQNLGISSNLKIIGMVGRLVPVKNFELYIRAAQKVIEQGIAVKFLIIGDGPIRTVLEELTARLKMQNHIIFTGFRDDVFLLVAMMDFFVLCSKSETNPIALMEAMASGKPVIATDVGGVSEVVSHGIDGLLCPSNDVNGLAQAMTHLLRSPDLAAILGRNAREKILKIYSLNRVTDQLMDVYSEIIRTE